MKKASKQKKKIVKKVVAKLRFLTKEELEGFYAVANALEHCTQRIEHAMRDIANVPLLLQQRAQDLNRELFELSEAFTHISGKMTTHAQKLRAGAEEKYPTRSR